MSRGIGKTQQAILDALQESGAATTTTELAESVGISPRQARAAVASLESRGMVAVRRNCHIGSKEGAYLARPRKYRGKDVPDVLKQLPAREVQYFVIPIRGTLVWSLDAWEEECALQRKMSSAGGIRLRPGWDALSDRPAS